MTTGADRREDNSYLTSWKSSRPGGAAIEQISLNLGHGSIEVTERYLDVDLDLQNAPSDYSDLKVERQERLMGTPGEPGS
jgi:hypothetical protein